jgi:heme/copper-type cytochrome/quinol oxidase subunit 2
MFLDMLQQQVIAQAINVNTLPNPTTDAGRLQTILNLVFGIIGAIALLVITLAGFKYVLSHGDPNLISQAKETIIYALIGLVISVAAIAIVNFVVVGVS